MVSGSSQPVGSPNGNRPPEVKALKLQSGSRFMIPRATPFALDATAVDPDGERVTLTWEQVDLGPSRLLGEPDIGKGPLFRSYKVVAGSSLRVFPQLDEALSEVWPKDEVMPQTKRDINFRVTARDERASGGAVGSDEAAISVVKSAGPFVVTEPKAAKQTSRSIVVKWDVANTDAADPNKQGRYLAVQRRRQDFRVPTRRSSAKHRLQASGHSCIGGAGPNAN